MSGAIKIQSKYRNRLVIFGVARSSQRRIDEILHLAAIALYPKKAVFCNNPIEFIKFTCKDYKVSRQIK